MRLMLGVVLCVAPLVAPGCSQSPSAVESETPRLTIDDMNLSTSLLDEEDLADLIGEVRGQSVNATEVFENPDPRGPCGGDAPPVPTTGASGRAFVSDRVTVIQLVLPRSDETDAFMEAQLSDIVDPCGPFESETNIGSMQQVSDIEVAELPLAGGFAATVQITNQGQSGFGGLGAAQSGEVVTVVAVIGRDRVQLVDMRSLIERAAERL